MRGPIPMLAVVTVMASTAPGDATGFEVPQLLRRIRAESVAATNAKRVP
jgi:hypothetical protein